MNKVTSTVGANKKHIETLLIVLILLNFAPYEVLDTVSPGLGNKVKSMLGVLANPVQGLMSHVFVRTILFVAMVVACCTIKDMNLFLILALYFVMVRR
jgi:hypothetical protein